jgi:GDP-L-fucose synthase
MHVDDLAAACLHVMSVSKSQYAEITGMDFPCINIGSGDEYSIEEIATLIKDATRYQGQFSFDRSKPDGTPRKLLDSTIIQKLGWTAERRFTHEIHSVYEDFVTRSLTGKMENVEKLSPYPLR